MEIEFGFQLNCSELVTHLGVAERGEVLHAMHVIAEMTGWKWAIFVHVRTGERDGWARTPVGVPLDALDALLVVDDENIFIDPRRLAERLEPGVSADILKALQRQREEPHVVESFRPVLVPTHAVNQVDGITNVDSVGTFMECSGNQKRGLCLIMQDWGATEMPVFHSIRRRFHSDFQTHDGGKLDGYAEWMAYHFYSKQLVAKRLAQEGRSHGTDDVCFWEQFPPLEPKEALDEAELATVAAWLGPLYDDDSLYDDWRRYRSVNTDAKRNRHKR